MAQNHLNWYFGWFWYTDGSKVETDGFETAAVQNREI